MTDRKPLRNRLGALGCSPAAPMDMRAGTIRISVCERAIERYAAIALMKRSPKMTAN